MYGVVLGAIAPHGDEILEDLIGELDPESKKLSEAMMHIARRIAEENPNVIIIATPHNLRLYKHIGIIGTEYAEGVWEGEKGSIRIRVSMDRELAIKLYDAATKENLPVILVNYGTDNGELSRMCLDWGTIIPLRFIEKAYQEKNMRLPKILLLTPSREIPLENLVIFGEVVNRVAEQLGRRAVFIASADQAHAHDPKGPYGFDEAAVIFDRTVLEIIRKNALERLLHLDVELVNRAKPDSLWQMLMLYGAIKDKHLKSTLVVYKKPTYFGMLTALFEP